MDCAFRNTQRNHPLCSDCEKSGFCAYGASLAKGSVPLKSTLEWRSASSPSPDIENINILNLAKAVSYSPHPDLKLRHKDCPFHLLKSIGLELISLFVPIVISPHSHHSLIV